MKKALSIILAMAMSLGTVTAFADEDRKKKAAESLKAQGVLTGDENGEFKLDDTVTRAQFCKLVLEVFETENTSSDAAEIMFSDVADTHWAYDYINAAAGQGIVNGFGDGTFKPEDSVTYEQAIKITVITSGLACGYESYPQGYISTAIDECLLDNINSLIGENMTRSDAVNLIYNAQQYTKTEKVFTTSVNISSKTAVKATSVSLINAASIEPTTSPAASAEPTVKPAVTPEPTEAPDTRPPVVPTLKPIPPSVTATPPAVIPTKKPGGSGAHGGSAGGSGSSVSSDRNGGTVMFEHESVEAAAMYINPYMGTEEYTAEEENIFKNAAISPLSTFSIDTDTASYSNMRRFIINGNVPMQGSVRSEEVINYFDYDLPKPEGGEPFSVTTEVSDCPWNKNNKFAMIGIKGEEITERAPQNLTLLIDVSGSMSAPNKLPLVKKSMLLLLDRLDERDTVSIVTYANGVNLVLEGTSAADKEKIMAALSDLCASGGTNGSGGLELAYKQAQKNKIDGNNRVILCTDGDFNIGPSSAADLEKLVKDKRDKGIFISVLGFGTGNYKDNRMEIIADRGDGSYYYIDSLREAKKVFVDEMTGTLYTIAKDVKIQVEFNPAKVKEYRLIGYENRRLNNEDFVNDKKDAGELGAGTSVVALYELITTDGETAGKENNGLRYQTSMFKESDELFCVNLRYKEPNGTESKLITKPVSETVSETSDNFRFAAAAAELGMILNDSEFAGTSSYADAISLARGARGTDAFGLRTEFVQLIDLLKYIDR